MKFLRTLFGFKPPPSGICSYCGTEAWHENYFAPGQFYHQSCAEAEIDRRVQANKDRAQIELYKTAMRELEAERNQPK